MSVSIISRPLGLKRETIVNVPVVNSSGNALFVNLSGHGLLTGYDIYVVSSCESYNGWKKIDVANSTQFLIKDDSGNFIPFFCDSASYYVNTTDSARYLNWFCIHLPIVYKVSNTLYPTNSEDSVRTINTVTDSNGFCALGLSADIKATGSANALQFVKITSATDDSLNGVWQIISYTNDTTFVISIPYSTANDTALTNASIQYYYNNYTVKVKVWTGLNSSHYFESVKPYELAAEFDITPDSDNLCVFSVHKLIASYVNLRNHLLLDTLPNNLDAFTQFYIEVAESYDSSDGSTLSTTTSSYTSDLWSFEPFAVNAKMPFKSVYAGALSDYDDQSSSQKFLTLFDEPVIFSGKYFDLSFIFDNSTSVQFLNNTFTSDLSNWVQLDNSGSAAWVFSGGNAVCSGATANTDFIGQLRSIAGGWPPGNYSITITATNTSTGGSAPFDSYVELWGTNLSTVAIENAIVLTGTSFWSVGAGAIARTLTFTTTKYYQYLFFDFFKAGPTGGYNVNIAVSSIVINSAPAFENSFPVLLQDSTYTDLDAFSSGVYRATLNDPDCNNTQVQVSISKAQNYGLPIPSSWSNFISAFTTKTATVFTTTAAGTTKSAYVNTPLSIATGKNIKLTIVTNINIATPGTSLIHVYLCGGVVGTPTSNTVTITVPAAAGSNTYEVELTATSTSGILFIDATLDAAGAGSTLTITPSTEFSYYDFSPITETKTLLINCECANHERYLSWMNYLGGFEYWNFFGAKDKGVNILDSGETKRNIFPTWPNSYGEFADSITVQTYRTSKDTELVRSQHLTEDQVEIIKSIKTAPLVQVVNSIYDRRTVIVDTDSFVVLKEIEKLHTVQFSITYTDEYPSQTI